jgi:hypothetical protein
VLLLDNPIADVFDEIKNYDKVTHAKPKTHSCAGWGISTLGDKQGNET